VGTLASVLVHGVALAAAVGFAARHQPPARPHPVEVVLELARPAVHQPRTAPSKAKLGAKLHAPREAAAPAASAEPAVALSSIEEQAPAGTDVEASSVSGNGVEVDGGVLGRQEERSSWSDAPAVIHALPPAYPPDARSAGREGRVRAKLLVSERGTVGRVALLESSGAQTLDRAALTALTQWRFRPAQRDGRPVAAWVIVPVRFSLRP